VHGLDREQLEGKHLERSLENLGAPAGFEVGSHAPLDGQKEKRVSIARIE
jgi:hypothetical protein